jgi:hypothetical protein
VTRLDLPVDSAHNPLPWGEGPYVTAQDPTVVSNDNHQAALPCLLLLFPTGHRPDASQIRAALGSTQVGRVSHDPRTNASIANHNPPQGDWLELLVDGLTFDLLGLAPGEPLSGPPLRHRFGVAADELADCEAIGLAPGPHLAGAASAMPVVRTLLRLGAALTTHCDHAVAAVWHPAASAIARQLFVDTVGAWLEGGAFPALGLVGVNEEADGVLVSDGLAFFLGQEIELVPPPGTARTAATRLLLRLIDRLIEPPMLTAREMVRLDDGTCISLDFTGRRIVASPR